MKKTQYACALIAAMMLATAGLHATVIVQKNGDVISGRILEEKPDKYVFQSPYGKLQIAKANVAKLILDEKAIELKEVKHNNKIVKARLVAEQNNTAVYLTEDGQTIRQQQGATPPAEAPAPTKDIRERVLVQLSGSFGLANFQQPQDSTAMGFDQRIRPGTWGASLGGHYIVSRFFSVGVLGSFYFSALNSTTTDQGPQGPVTYNTATTNMAFLVSAGGSFSVFGNLPLKQSAHDLRLEVYGGYSMNRAEMLLNFGSNRPPNFPTEGVSKGRANAPAVQLAIAYVYALTDSLRLRSGIAVTRFFYPSIYADGFESNPLPPGQFKAEFDKNIGQTGVQPTVISALVGLEMAF
ncbi:MAG: hypothetical protein JNJ69_17665 [Leptospiraceae bacterium]|nr:hypothetical protein [Leptospiraceae bacterium]